MSAPETLLTQEERPSPRRNLGQIILRNALAVFTGSTMLKVVNTLFTVFAAYTLGANGIGQYASVVAFVGLFGVFFELGLSQYVQRSLAQDPGRAEALLGNLLLLRLMLAIGGVAAMTGLAFLRGFSPELSFGVTLFACTFLLAALKAPLETLLSANERFDLLTIGQVANQLATVAVSTILLLSGVGFMALIYAGFVAMPIEIVISIWAIRRARIALPRPRISPHAWPALVRASLPFGITSLALTFNFYADRAILSMFHPAEMVGWYDAAYRLVFTLVSLADAFLLVITPSLAREHIHDPTHVRGWAHGSVYTILLLALPAAAGASLLATPIISLLYGPTFVPAGAMLAMIAWDIPVLLFTALCGNLTAAVGLEHPASRIYLLSAALNIALNLLLIPRLGGLGAAIVTVLTDTISAYLFYRLLATRMDLRALVKPLARAVLAAALMGGAVWVARDLGLPFLLNIALGALVYGGLAIGMRLVDPALFQQMAGKLRRVRS